MKKIQTTTYNRLKGISMKEIMDAYPDKVVDVKSRESDVVLTLDTCRIVFKRNNKQRSK